MRKWMSVCGGLTLGLVGYTMVVSGSPASGVTPKLLARGTYDGFKVKSETRTLEFEAEAKPKVDLVVRQHDYAKFSTTGWHSHPGPVFITVVSGTLTVYEYDDPNCTPRTLEVGQGYLDTGKGHLIRNETDQPARDMTVIVAPVGESFRGELEPRLTACGF